MNKIYKFVGGPWHNQTLIEDEALFVWVFCGDGLCEDLSEIRKKGGCVHRAELDNELQFAGYLGPMLDGTRRINGEEVYVLRYETQEVYDMLSH